MDLQKCCLKMWDFVKSTSFPLHLSGPVDHIIGLLCHHPLPAPYHCVPYKATSPTNPFYHKATRYPHNKLHVAGCTGYHKCPQCYQYVKGDRHQNSALCHRGRKCWAARVTEEQLMEESGNLPTFYIEGWEIEQVYSFTYLGHELTLGDDNFQACLQNLAKVKNKGGVLSQVLKREGASAAFKTQIYLIVVLTVLLYGPETRVINTWIWSVLVAGFYPMLKYFWS